MRAFLFIGFLFFSLGLLAHSSHTSNIETDTLVAKGLVQKALLIEQQITSSLPSKDKIQRLDEVYMLLNSASEIDSTLELIDMFKSVAQQYFYTGVELFNNSAYSLSLSAFESCIAISNRKDVASLDTLVLLNTAMAAEKANELNKAISYYRQLIDFQSDSWVVYAGLANIYKQQKQHTLFKQTINEGIRKYPESKIQFTQELLAYYLESNQYHLALSMADSIISDKGLTPHLSFLKGSIYHQQNHLEKAAECYRTCLSLQKNNIDAAYNLSIILYNHAFDLTEQNQFDINELKSLCSEAVLSLNIVHIDSPKNIKILRMMQFCYYHLKNQILLDETSNKIKSLIEDKESKQH